MKKLVSILLVIIMIFTLCGCGSEPDEALKAEIARLEIEKSEINTQIDALESELSALKQEVVNTKIETGNAKYILTINIRQTHFTLDIGQHLKDAMNDISIQIPVDKEYFDSLEIGDVIDDSFRMGSFIFKGSFGNWKVTVEDKDIM